MRRQNFFFFVRGIFLLCIVMLLGAGRTGAEVFVIDSGQSQITLSGDISGYTFTAQGPGSLTATYEGSINATFSGSSIQFTGSSTIMAITNGVWKPGLGGGTGTAPADYGAQVAIPLLGTSYGAGRNIVLDMTSPLLTLTQTNFDSSQLIVTLVTNTSPVPVFDYRNLLQNGSLPISGSVTNAATTGSFISTNGDLLRLEIQIDATLSGTNNSTMILTGKIVATNSLSVFMPPVIAGVVATNQNLVLTVSNATAQSLLLSSTTLTNWSPADATVSTNNGFIIFTTPMSGPYSFFRVQK